jgi:predicted PhzF superfamily epimerase YddE/YHI9
MTRGELPFAGTPRWGPRSPSRWRAASGGPPRPATPAGRQPIDVEVTGERTARASMLQEPATFGPELDPAPVLAAAGVDPALADPALPAQVVSTGAAQVLAPVEPEALRTLRPDFAALEALLGEHGAVTLYLAPSTASGPRPVALPRARRRVRGPGDRLGRRPAHGLPARAPRPRRVRVEQGVEMGRASVLDCASRATGSASAATRSSSRTARSRSSRTSVQRRRTAVRRAPDDRSAA